MAYKNILNTVDHVDGILAEVGFGKGNDLSDIIGYMNDGIVTTRQIALFDSFEGQPEPTDIDEGAFQKGDHNRPIQPAYDIANTIKTDVCICEGWVEDTFEKCIKDTPCAVVHLDLIGYESTLYSLNTAFKYLVEEGVIIIKDYDNYIGVKKATDKFADTNKLSINKSGTIAFIYRPKVNKTVTNKKVNRTWSSTLT